MKYNYFKVKAKWEMEMTSRHVHGSFQQYKKIYNYVHDVLRQTLDQQ